MAGTKPRSIIISWLGYENGLVKQDVVRLGRRTPEQAVTDFVGDHAVAHLIGWKVWA